MEEYRKLVSVIIPTYNREKTIERSIRSVLNQTYRTIEVLVIDDGSLDQTRTIVHSIADNRLRYYYQNHSGACSARNKGISLSGGQYIAFQDSDDVWHENKLEIQINAMEAQNADIVCCQINQIAGYREPTIIPKMEQSQYLKHSDIMCGISTQTLVMKKSVANDIKFDDRMPRFQDFEWVLRATRKYTLYAISQVLVDCYLSEDSITNSGEKMLYAIDRLLIKNPDLKAEVPGAVAALRSLLIEEGIKVCRRSDEAYIEFIDLAIRLDGRITDRIRYLLAKNRLSKELLLLHSLLSMISKWKSRLRTCRRAG